MKEFNITGVCVPEKHYMVNISSKLEKIINLIEKEAYFTINRARQYGKTTTLAQINKKLNKKYLILSISFEGLGEQAFSNENSFVESFTRLITKRLKQNKIEKEIIAEWEDDKSQPYKIEDLSEKITRLIENNKKEVILIIDEVDKSSNNQLFLTFLGMLRNKHLDRTTGYDLTFKSVILAGVYSPWNIAADFDVDMSFSAIEIATMLKEYEKDHQMSMDIESISSVLYKFTSGYPFLVSKLCKIIDEKLEKNWTLKGVENAVKLLINEKNTLFDDLIKNLENNKEIYTFGIFTNDNGNLAIHNKIFEIVLYNYLISKKHSEEIGKRLFNFTAIGIYEKQDGSLDIQKALIKFQEYIKSVYGKFDKEFVERQGRLLLLAFFKPILNGKGFYFVESQTGFEQRQDVVITYGEYKYIIELKIWRGEQYHNEGICQLEAYLNTENVDKGYMVIFDKNENKKYKSENFEVNEKQIYAIWV